MKECFQTENQTVYDHGLSVWKYTQRILNNDWDDMLFPDWFKENFELIKQNLYNEDIIKEYNIFHDCGKPYCLEVDSEGKQHFPNHAQVSSDTWSKISNNETVRELISLDMMLHVETANQINEKELSNKVLFTLLVTAFAELHSNANMFGGIDSLSFKIKYKKICKRGKMLMRGLLS